MGVRSVLDIDLQKESWDQFLVAWNEWQKQLKEQPEIWKKISAIQAKVAGALSEHKSTFEMHLSNLKNAQEAEEANQKVLMRSHSLWEGIAGASKNTSEHIKSMTLSMLKWTGLFSGISALTSYFSLAGLMNLGTDVYGWRKSSMGLGVTSGQERAFNIAFGPLLGNTSGFLSGVNAAVSDISQQTPLWTLGVNPNQSTAQVAIDTLKAIRRIALATPVNQLGIAESIYGLGSFNVGVEDLRRFKEMSSSEFGGMLGMLGTTQHNLALNDRTQLAWTRFIQSMDTAKGEIENVFVRGLVRLTGPLERLAGGFAHLLGVVMRKDGPISKDLDAIAKWMDSWNGEISKPQFLKDIDNFVLGIHKLAVALGFTAPTGAPKSTTHTPVSIATAAAHGLGGFGLAEIAARFLGKKFAIPAAIYEGAQGKYAKGAELALAALSWEWAVGLLGNTWLSRNAPSLDSWSSLIAKIKGTTSGGETPAQSAADFGALAPYQIAQGSAAATGVLAPSSQSDIMLAVRYLVAELKTFLSTTPSVTVKTVPGSNAVAAVSTIGASR